ncbi:hypothetical protein BO70DRAFT_356948 [Aspergillus heteromorphus CBS 117.55]|uniref:Uncharacterized protein n=1 Tax=Aspergillus heteromorphus CBS 117.55 TaxID=1448321 RepID=A0A317UR60_9EURO|nr:uncharacterized protein BO70DRAFT_356948 [Aspergillus heteromorphus CBS 117.55]PWY64513.1 hypothetical protein BO70DRAFT_356948 [Aspergillus heteromorphus CBS 117.55]
MQPRRFIISPVLYLVYFLAVAICSESQPLSAEIFCWPLSSPGPSIVTRISYEVTAQRPELISFSTPTTVDCDYTGSDGELQGLIRLGLYTSTATNPNQWVGTLVSRSSLIGSDDCKPTLQLHIGPSNKTYHVELQQHASRAASSTPMSPQLELISYQNGPRPHLNQPLIIGPDGKNADEVFEKTFFQKYWWLFLIIAFLVMSGGGESQ